MAGWLVLNHLIDHVFFFVLLLSFPYFLLTFFCVAYLSDPSTISYANMRV